MLLKIRRTLIVRICVLTTVLSAAPTLTRSARAQSAESVPITLLSPDAMDALVSGSAFYPDEVVEHILQAAQQPSLLHEAATGAGQQSNVPSIRYLTQYPDLLRQLDEQLPLTARLGVAARTQIQDVWTSIDRVRAGFDAASDIQQELPIATSGQAAAPTANAYVPPAYSRYAAGLWAGAAIRELHQEYGAYHNSQTTTGAGGGTATTTSTSGQVTQGNTTYSGVAGAATVTGPNGNTVNGVGAAGSSVTNTGSGYQTQTAAMGAIGNPATGNYAAGAYSGSGYTQQNADGSTSFGREATTSTQSSFGSTTVNRESTGTAAGAGNSSYSGSTNINSTYGNASVETQAGNSQISTTVTTSNGSQTFTAGDGTVGNSSAENSSAKAVSPQTVAGGENARSSNGSSPFSRQSAQSGQSSRSGGSQFGRGSAPTRGSQFSRPTSRAPSSSFNPSATRNSNLQRSQRSYSSPSSRSGASRSGGGRSGGGRSGGRRGR